MEQSMKMKAQQKSQVKENPIKNSIQGPMRGSIHNPMQSQMYSYPEGESAQNYIPREVEQHYQPQESRMRQVNNENINPYMLDTAFHNQM
jgi:hypothetical protein